jgi:hypothetical protein
MCFRDAPAPELSFGDFCAGELFYDAYLRADASSLRERTVSGSFVRREFNRDELTSYIPVDESVAGMKYQPGRDYLLAHGTAWDEAVCLSDDCEIASRLGRGGVRDASGRLLFAPVSRLREDDIATLTEGNWGRMRVGDSVVELRRVFAVAAEDVGGADALRRRSLDDEHALRLATWWAAYATRRGPMVDVANLGKLRRIGEARGVQEAAELEGALTAVLAFAWRLVGGGVEWAGAEYDENREDLSAVDWEKVNGPIREQFAALERAVSEASGLFA